MSKRKPMHTSRKPTTATEAGEIAGVAVGHALVLGTTTTGKTFYDQLRLTEHELRRVRRKPADGRRDAGDEAWV